MNKENYQAIMEQTVASFCGRKPKLILQSCCGPCSSYVLECLRPHFEIGLYYYNPNIHPAAEYERRLSEQKRYVALTAAGEVEMPEAPYDPQAFFEAAKGLENEPEGGARCARCFRLRLEKTAQEATARGAEFFGTTLTVSPHKNAPLINAIGRELEKKYGVRFLLADFKKKEGYKRSIALSKEYGLYRQEYCGCVFSLERK